MECKNHPGVTAVDRCAGCAEPFCQDCLVDVHGQKFCSACKVMALQGGAMPEMVMDQATQTCKEATNALIWAIVSLFCCGIITAPIALSKASKARQLINANPSLGGSGQATAATVVAIIALVLNIIAIIVRVSTLSRM